MRRRKSILMLSVMFIGLFLMVLMAATRSAAAREQQAVSANQTGETDEKGLVETRTLAQPGEVAYLTGANEGEPLDIALAFIQANREALGLTSADLVDVVVTDQYITDHNQVTHIYLRQRYNGIEVSGANININIAPDGSVMSIGSSFVGNLSEVVQGKLALSAVTAVETAAAHLGLTLTEPLVIEEAISGPAQQVTLSDGGISLESIPAKLVYQPSPDGLHLAWDLLIYQLDALHYWSIRLDAATGEVLGQYDLVIHEDFLAQVTEAGHELDAQAAVEVQAAPQGDESSFTPDQYLVYAWPVESPNHTSPVPPADARTLQVNPATLASPFGWHDTNGAAGAEFTVTRGNNVNAYEDGNNPGFQPNCGAALNCSFPINLSQHPNNYEAAAIANLFYWNNIIHDVWYNYGFTESAGNFQENNYGNGGAGSDSVNAEAQDGSGTCNANMATPSDGNNPRMQMYICNNSSPAHDGDLDNAVIVHEYTHGISNRLTGGPGTTGCLSNAEQMGEGWSDWYGLMMTIEAGDSGPDARGIGTYLFGQPANGPGIRPAPYSTNFSVNGFTYDDIKTAAVPHGVGFVWATMLWEMNWELINNGVSQSGLDPNIYTGNGGNNLAMQLVTDGMKLQPCSPGFVNGRDAILQADVALTGGANQCAIWRAFARRGLGFSANQGSSGSRSDGTEAFNMPPACLGDNIFTPRSQVVGDGSGVHTYPTLTGDVDGDGRTDLIFIGQNWNGAGLNIRTKFSNGDGTWTSRYQVVGDGSGVHTYPALTGDVNGDGRTDIIFVGQGWNGAGLNIRTKLSNGDGTWTSRYQVVGDGSGVHTYPTLTGDVNGDGRTDLIFVGQNWNGTGLNIRTKFSNGNGTWTSAYQVVGDGSGVHTYPALTGDVNGDGRTDIMFIGQNWNGTGLNIRTKFSNGNGTWNSAYQVVGDGSGVHTYPALTGDVNGDGRTDIMFVGQNWNGTGLNIRTKFSNGNGTWTSRYQVLGDGSGVHTYPALTGDVNGDGRTDIIFVGQGWNGAGLNVRVKQSNGNGNWTSRFQVLGDGSGVHTYPTLTGDINGDAQTDLIFVGQGWSGTGLNIRVKIAN